MSISATEWLAAREAVDTRSRSKELAIAFAAAIGPDDLVADIGCGTGTNIRFLAPFMSPSQKWLGLDHDSDVLAQAELRLMGTGVVFEKMNLATDMLRVPAGEGCAATASAFLDVTSEQWLNEFASHFRDTPLLVAMSAAGQPEWYPGDQLDIPISLRIEMHQKSDHGFGPSLGPSAIDYLSKRLRGHGCQVTLCESNWTLGPEDFDLIEMMIEGVARRVESAANRIDAREWMALRKNQLRAGELSLVIKHRDLLSIPKRLV